jgi:hypothetical protein
MRLTLLFRSSLIRISAATPANLMQIYGVFPRSDRKHMRTVPEIWLREFLAHHFQFIFKIMITHNTRIIV